MKIILDATILIFISFSNIFVSFLKSLLTSVFVIEQISYLESQCNVHFWTNTHGKGMNSLIYPAMD